MKISINKGLFFLALACLLLPYQVNDQGGNHLPPTYLELTKENVVFDMSLSYKDYYGSGLLVVKRVDTNNYHGVFLSKVGLKLMEFKFVSGNFQWIKLLDYLDKKGVKKILERDFRMLLLADIENASRFKKIKLLFF